MLRLERHRPRPLLLERVAPRPERSVLSERVPPILERGSKAIIWLRLVGLLSHAWHDGEARPHGSKGCGWRVGKGCACRQPRPHQRRAHASVGNQRSTLTPPLVTPPREKGWNQAGKQGCRRILNMCGEMWWWVSRRVAPKDFGPFKLCFWWKSRRGAPGNSRLMCVASVKFCRLGHGPLLGQRSPLFCASNFFASWGRASPKNRVPYASVITKPRSQVY